jgi:hypothetical protein
LSPIALVAPGCRCDLGAWVSQIGLVAISGSRYLQPGTFSSRNLLLPAAHPSGINLQ